MATIMSADYAESTPSLTFKLKAMESVRQQRLAFVRLAYMTRRISDNFDPQKFFERHNTDLGEEVLEKLFDSNVKAIKRMEESFASLSSGTSLIPPCKMSLYNRVLEHEKERLQTANENYFQWKLMFSRDDRFKIAL